MEKKFEESNESGTNIGAIKMSKRQISNSSSFDEKGNKKKHLYQWKKRFTVMGRKAIEKKFKELKQNKTWKLVNVQNVDQ